jgi:hypothetical protein
MTVGLRDKFRQEALAKMRRLDAARDALAKLTDDQCSMIYIEIESRLTKGAKTRSDATAKTAEKDEPGRRHCRICGGVGHNARSCKKAKTADAAPKAKGKAKKAASRPKWTDMIEGIIRENPHGLRTYEISKKTSQSDPHTFGILRLLERTGRVERHGERYKTLWTLPGIEPVPRIETIPDAAVHVLSKAMEPMDSRKLREEVGKLLQRNIGKKPHLSSLKTEISRLISKDIIARSGANEHGPMYVLVARKGGDAASTLN